MGSRTSGLGVSMAEAGSLATNSVVTLGHGRFAEETENAAVRAAYTNAQQIEIPEPPIREIVLAMEADEYELTHKQLADLQRHYGSANKTETVMRAVEDAHEIEFKTPDPDGIQPD